MAWLRIERVTWAERALWIVLVIGSITPTILGGYVYGLALRNALEYRPALDERGPVLAGGYDWRQREVHAARAWRADGEPLADGLESPQG